MTIVSEIANEGIGKDKTIRMQAIKKEQCPTSPPDPGELNDEKTYLYPATK